MSSVIAPGARLAVLMDDHLQDPGGKMGHGVLRYSRHEVVAVVSAEHVGGDVAALTGIPRTAPIVATPADAAALGADVLIVGYQGPGGRLVPGQRERITAGGGGRALGGRRTPRPLGDGDRSVGRLRLGQRIVDLRVEPPEIGVATRTSRGRAGPSGRHRGHRHGPGQDDRSAGDALPPRPTRGSPPGSSQPGRSASA